MSEMDVNGDLSDVEGEDEANAVRELTKDDIHERLSLLWRIGNGYTFVRLDLPNNSLSDVSVISRYSHIRFLDLTNNNLTDLSPLAAQDHLLWLKVDKNAAASFKGQPFAGFPFLQWLSIAANRVTDLDGLVGPAALESLNLTGNSIQLLNNFQSDNFTNLVSLGKQVGNYQRH
uniref:Leucine rich repeat containing 23 n=1 Tax=Nothobranchius furzeri TaxID=105023 RepID=A0A1A8AJ72_NOTFU